MPCGWWAGGDPGTPSSARAHLVRAEGTPAFAPVLRAVHRTSPPTAARWRPPRRTDDRYGPEHSPLGRTLGNSQVRATPGSWQGTGRACRRLLATQPSRHSGRPAPGEAWPTPTHVIGDGQCHRPADGNGRRSEGMYRGPPAGPEHTPGYAISTYQMRRPRRGGPRCVPSGPRGNHEPRKPPAPTGTRESADGSATPPQGRGELRDQPRHRPSSQTNGTAEEPAAPRPPSVPVRQPVDQLVRRPVRVQLAGRRSARPARPGAGRRAGRRSAPAAP